MYYYISIAPHGNEANGAKIDHVIARTNEGKRTKNV